MAQSEPVPTVLTTLKIQEVLDKNFEYIKVITDCQKRGMIKEAVQYQQLLKENLTLLAKQAERTPPSDINQVLSRIHMRNSGRPVPGMPNPGPCPAHLVPMASAGAKAAGARQTGATGAAFGATPLNAAPRPAAGAAQGSAPLSAHHVTGAAAARPAAASSLTAAVAASRHLHAADSSAHAGLSGRQPGIGPR